LGARDRHVIHVINGNIGSEVDLGNVEDEEDNRNEKMGTQLVQTGRN